MKVGRGLALTRDYLFVDLLREHRSAPALLAARFGVKEPSRRVLGLLKQGVVVTPGKLCNDPLHNFSVGICLWQHLPCALLRQASFDAGIRRVVAMALQESHQRACVSDLQALFDAGGPRYNQLVVGAGVLGPAFPFADCIQAIGKLADVVLLFLRTIRAFLLSRTTVSPVLIPRPIASAP